MQGLVSVCPAGCSQCTSTKKCVDSPSTIIAGNFRGDTVHVNKKFTFDDRRTIVLRCERLRFVPDETVRERKRNGAKTVCKTVH